MRRGAASVASSQQTMKVPARLYEELPGSAVRCGTCQRHCEILPGEVGWCRTRRNEGGTLVSLIYGEVSSLSVNPIEKKPVFHFHPGSKWLSLGSVGCNFRCAGCQNWELSHWTHGDLPTRYLPPAEAVTLAIGERCLGISWTFNEPTLWFEYTLDTAKLARQAGLRTNYVTNGTISPAALDELIPYLDVFRVDIKAYSDLAYRRIGHHVDAQGIRDVVLRAKRAGTHVELVTNLIPGLNDAAVELTAIARWIAEEVGPDTPWHVTRFYPHHHLAQLPPTTISALEAAHAIGLRAGICYVYLGNVPGHPWEHTYCHVCGTKIIERYQFTVVRNDVKGGCCPHCGEGIPGRF